MKHIVKATIETKLIENVENNLQTAYRRISANRQRLFLVINNVMVY